MTTLPMNNSITITDEKSKYTRKFINQIMALPGVKVDRETFLRGELSSYCPEEQVAAAITSRPAVGGIPISEIDHIADSVIKSHVLKAGIGSFAAGLPGGFAMLATIPADTSQFFLHALILAQKLAYLYGWPDLLDHGSVDEETELLVLMLLGSMLGVSQANNMLKIIAKSFAQEVEKRVAKQALTKTFYYSTLKKAVRWIGIKITKQSFAKGLSKLVPVASGVTSAGLTTVALRGMARKLKKHLRELEYAQPTRKVIPVDVAK